MMSHRVEHSKRNSISTHAHILLCFPIERGARQVSRPSFTVEIPMLSLVTALVRLETSCGINVICIKRANDKATNMEKINSKGKTFVNGCALSQDLRKLIVDEIVRNGGDINTGYFPGKFSNVANAFKVSRTTMKNIWQRLHMERTNKPRQHGG